MMQCLLIQSGVNEKLHWAGTLILRQCFLSECLCKAWHLRVTLLSPIKCSQIKCVEIDSLIPCSHTYLRAMFCIRFPCFCFALCGKLLVYFSPAAIIPSGTLPDLSLPSTYQLAGSVHLKDCQRLWLIYLKILFSTGPPGCPLMLHNSILCFSSICLMLVCCTGPKNTCQCVLTETCATLGLINEQLMLGPVCVPPKGCLGSPALTFHILKHSVSLNTVLNWY